MHPLRKRWMSAAWCGSALGDFGSPDEAAAALIGLIELAGGDQPQPPSSTLTHVHLLRAPNVNDASVVAEVIADLSHAIPSHPVPSSS
jgi:hypothetical protein